MDYLPWIHHGITSINKSCDGNAEPGSKNTQDSKRRVQQLNVKVCSLFLYILSILDCIHVQCTMYL